MAEERQHFMAAMSRLAPLPADQEADRDRNVELRALSSDYSDVSTQIPVFVYRPDASDTAEIWISRVRGVFRSAKGQRVDDLDKTAIIRSKLPDLLFQQLAAAVKPKNLEDLSLEETFAKVQEHFGKKESIFMQRMRVWRVRREEEEDIDSLAARVNKAVEDFDLSSFTSEDFKNLVFVNSMRMPTDGNLTKKLLEKAQQHHAERVASADPAQHPALKFATLVAMVKHQ